MVNYLLDSNSTRKKLISIDKVKSSLHASQVVYSGFCSMNWDKEYFYSPLDGMLVHHRVTPSVVFASTHLHTRIEKGTVRLGLLMSQVAHQAGAYPGFCSNAEATRSISSLP